MFLWKYEEKLLFLTEGVFVTQLSSNVGIYDVLCELWQTAVSWAIRKDFIFILNASSDLCFRHYFEQV